MRICSPAQYQTFQLLWQGSSPFTDSATSPASVLSVDYTFDFMLKESAELSTVYPRGSDRAMSEPGNPENERLSDIEPWEKIERRANLKKSVIYSR